MIDDSQFYTWTSGFIISFLAGYFLNHFWCYRAKKIDRKIAELNQEEKEIETLAKGYKELIRSSFHILFIVLFSCFHRTGFS